MKVFTSLAFAFGLSLLSPIQAFPLSLNESLFEDDVHFPNLHRRANPGDFYLRIMPLGASITAGDVPEPTNPRNTNGYRKFLRDKLRVMGWHVNMVGSRQSGDMIDNSHEGVSGETVRQAAVRGVSSARAYKPNLILINVGTNDARINSAEEPVQSQHLRMEEMLLSLFSALDQNSVIIVSTLLPCTNGANCGDNVATANRGYRGVVAKLAAAPYNKKILLAEMNDGSFITTAHIHDGIHPTVEGQRRMAAVWLDAINRALANNWIGPPADNGGSDAHGTSFTCSKELGSGNSNGRAGWQVLAAGNPLIRDDGRYRHSSIPHQNVHSSNTNGRSVSRQSILFANLFKVNPNAEARESRDELVIIERVTQPAGSTVLVTNQLRWWKNTNGVLEGGSGRLYGGAALDCDVEGVRFGDVDGDGYDDLLCVAEDGQVDLFRNNGAGENFRFEAKVTFRQRRPGCRRENVRFGDIDGDGRVDYCCIGCDGNIFCARNGYRPDPRAQNWQDLGIVFTSKGMGDIRGVKFADVNGDGRSDWIWLSETGKSTIYINQRGDDKSLRPLWTLAEVAHGGGFTGLHDPGSRNGIQFGRFFGSGRYDYMVVHGSCGGALGYECHRTIHAYENKGSGGRFQKGDGARWGDMRGRGVDDYIWISPDGVVNLFPNRNTKEDTATYGDISRGIWAGVYPPIATGKDRRSLHIADWNGDGKDDIISVSKWNGHLTIWLTAWSGSTYTPRIIHRNSAVYCNQGWGVGYFDNGHHFADINGDGRADFLCMQKNGHTTAWMNDGAPGEDGTLRDVGQVKFSENLDRENFRFAPVLGGPRMDMIWLDKFGGHARVWKNLRYLPGEERTSGSKVHWQHLGARYLQSARGANIHFPNLGGQGRADMVEVRAASAHGFAWFNMCPSGGTDDSGFTDPNLPSYQHTPVPDSGGIDDPDDASFCSNPDDWNFDLWNRLDMRGWMRQMLHDYKEAPQWPQATTPGGIPSIVAEFNRFESSKRFTWKPNCRAVNQQTSCDIEASDLTPTDKCNGHARRAFLIWSARNYAKYLSGYYHTVTIGVLGESLKFGQIAQKFSESNIGNEGIGLSSWFTIANGILSTVVGFVPGGAGQIAASALTGLLGLTGTVSGLLEDKPEEAHMLEVWSNLSGNFGDALAQTQNSLWEHFSQLLASPPDNTAADLFLNILGSGGFADEHTSTFVPPSASEQSRMIRAAAISAIWNQQRVFLFRFDNVHVGDYVFDKCRTGDSGQNGFQKDGTTVCIGGVNYSILKWEMDFDRFSNKEFGQSASNLQDFGFSHADVYEGAWKRQEIVRSFHVGDNTRNTFGRHLDRLIQSQGSTNVETLSMTDFIQWTIPVCNWQNTPKDNSLRSGCSSHTFRCLWHIIIWNCAQMHYSGDHGAGWPYREDLPTNPYEP